MEKRIILRGVAAGGIAGVLAFVFARIFVEPQIELAIGYEDGVGAAHEALEQAAAASSGVAGHSHGAEADGFSRAIQMNLGMGLGVLAFSIAIAALVAVVFAVTYGRVGNVSVRLMSLYIAGGMLVSLFVVPALKYPPSPPALSLDHTITQRTQLYLLMVVLSVALLIGAVFLGRRLVPRLGAWNATLSSVGAYVAAASVAMLALPTIDETPGPLVNDAGVIVYEGFPADLLYDFRLYSLGTQIVMYATIGLVFGALVSRLLGQRKNTPVA